MILIWQCDKCKQKKHSIDLEINKPISCKCKTCTVSSGEEYFRLSGPIKTLKVVDMDFYAELWTGLTHQDIKLPLSKNKVFGFYVYDTDLINELEYELIKELY